MIDRTSRLTVMLEAQQWDAVLNILADAPFKIAAPLIQDIQRQCLQQSVPSEDSSEATQRRIATGNGEARAE
jgi:hypothetical protein